MKKIILILFVLIFIQSAGYSQYWTEQTSGVTVQLTSVSPISDQNIWVCGYSGTVLRTTNGGTLWQNVSGGGIPNTISLINIWGIDASTALVAGYLGSDTWVWRTSNSGANWVQVFSQPGGFINGIVMKRAQPNHGLMQGDPVGGRWSLWKTTNGGLNWDSTGSYLPQTGSDAGWNNSICIGSQALYSTRDSLIWFGTNNTRVYYSSNFGTTWIVQSTSPEINSYAIGMLSMGNQSEGLAGGTTLMRTTNSGMNWISQTSVGTGSFSGFVLFPAPVDYGYCWYTRNTTSIYRGTNGSNWAVEYTAPAGNYRHFASVRNGTYCWGVRSNGGITKCAYYFSGIGQFGNEIPPDYALGQNYPNPFNPITNVKIQMPKSGFVTLKVFDALGKEVRLLVNQNLNPGTYEVDFDGTDLPSGVYYYRLDASSPLSTTYSETRKMVLTK
jgi:photosystem II stability/assembly factor-like uncharacterized protein